MVLFRLYDQFRMESFPENLAVEVAKSFHSGMIRLININRIELCINYVI